MNGWMNACLCLAVRMYGTSVCRYGRYVGMYDYVCVNACSVIKWIFA